jgi:DNA polymerase-3 subunit alpha
MSTEAAPRHDQNFVHLHVHTEYSMLDGAARIGDLFSEAARMGMPALATTDHGYVFGAYEFWKKSQGTGVKPIIGVEAYITPGTHRSDRTKVSWGDGGRDDISGGGAYTHMTMLAQNNEGMHNLFRMSSIASLDQVYTKWPRIDRELLSTYGKGLIVTTGCPSSEIQTKLRFGMYDEAREVAGELRDIFGRENVYVELMDHGLEIERRTQRDLIRLARDLDLPLVATNDLHYTKAEDAKAHAALLCVQSGSTLMDPNRFKFDADDFYLKSAAEMRHLWRELPEACDNTLLIAERCEVSFTEGEGRYMPRFPCPPGEDETSWFIKEVETGLQRRFPEGVPDYARKQAAFEEDVIVSKGYPGYFLVVADFINWAKRNGIRVGPGRGSGAGSMCAYAMGITDLDPIPHGLIFERFLNPERMSMPDFDVDFDERRRGEVIRYVTEKYGEERVAQIVTYGTIKAKQAIKDASRVLGHPFSMGEKLTKAMPPAIMGKDIPLTGIFDPQHKRYNEAADFRAVHDEDPAAQEVVATALGLEGLKRQWGVHAAGVIMSSEPLIDVIPIMRRLQDGQMITQFDYPSCESLGLVKMDFLGLRNLTILDDALENITLNRDEEIDLDALSKDMTDPATYALLGRGDTLGVFQLDGGGMRALLRLMQPDNFEDISAALALYRPGPMGVNAHTNFALRKNGKQELIPLDPQLKGKLQPEMVSALEPILKTTYGLVIYQEQVMEIAQKLAGYTLGNADLLRRAMGKKKKEVLDAEYVPFSEGMKAQGFTEASIAALWGVLVPFSDYAFNKAHTAAYGLVSYWTAYLKANYPAEYMAALLTSVRDDKDKSALYLNECRHMGIKVLPPDVNESIANFAAVGTDIRFGLAAIRNVGLPVVEAIIQGACRRVQQAHHRVAHQGRGVRLPRREPSRPGRGARALHRRPRRGEEAGGDRAGQPLRLLRHGRGRRRRWPRRLRRPPAGAAARVGQGHAALLRARDARPLRLRPPALRHRAHPRHARRHLDRLAHGRRPQGRRHARHRGRPHHEPAAQAHEEGRPLGHRDRRGPRRRHRVPLLPVGLHDLLDDARPGHRLRGQGSGQRPRRLDLDLRPGADHPRHQGGPARSCGPDVAAQPRHAAGRREPQARARGAPRRHGGAGAPDPARPHGAHVSRRLPARQRDLGPLRRPQGPARPGLPHLRCLTR